MGERAMDRFLRFGQGTATEMEEHGSLSISIKNVTQVEVYYKDGSTTLITLEHAPSEPPADNG